MQFKRTPKPSMQQGRQRVPCKARTRNQHVVGSPICVLRWQQLHKPKGLRDHPQARSGLQHMEGRIQRLLEAAKLFHL